MDFEKALKKELELQRDFLKQYKAGKESVQKYSTYRLTVKRGKEFLAVNRETRREIYLSKKKKYIVRALRKFKLCETGIKVVETNIKALERLLKVYRPYDPTALEETLSAAYRMNVDEMRTIRPAAGQRFTQSENPQHPEHLKHITSFGLVVRSRIEAAAAELAYSRGYYIMYEKRIILYDEEGNAYVIYPDFILCENENSPDAAWVYWEHLGLLDMSDYRERTMLKLKLFPQNGIMPGRNLILTTDGMNESIDLMAVSNVLNSINNLEVT